MKENYYRIWFYSVSLEEMLLRSRVYENNKHIKNIDICLRGVSYIEMPTTLENMELCEPNDSDYEYIKNKIDINEEELIVLSCEGKRYYIVAVHKKIIENSLESHEIPDWFANSLLTRYK